MIKNNRSSSSIN